MPESDPKIRELEDRLDALVRTQIDFQKEISAIRGELVRLHARRMAAEEDRSRQSFYQRGQAEQLPESPRPKQVPPGRPQMPAEPPPAVRDPVADMPRVKPPARPSSVEPEYELPRRTTYQPDPILSSATVSGDAFSRFAAQYTENARANLEKFVGANLISLIGIIVLVLGVGIGAKYAIDNDLISPLTRIVIGYAFGFGLVGLALKLKSRYHAFSAVLISGGMAIMYFVTYFAYASYNLISQLPAFGLMVMFTAATVTAALVYSRQVIAHVGLVGAYAVPFLLSSDSGNYLALFIYMSVINTGILAISLKKKWNPIFYTASLFTWAIFCGWFATKYSPTEHFTLALVFLGVFSTVFYGTKLAQMSLFDDAGSDENIVASGLTLAVFHAICFAMINGISHEPLRYWTLFTYLAAGSVAIVVTSLKFYGRAIVFYASASFTWVTFCTWLAWRYTPADYFELTLTFLAIFAAVFYGATLVQSRRLATEFDRNGNLAAAVVNSAVFYFVGLALILHSALPAAGYWTLFTYIAAASVVILATSLRFFGRALVYVVVPLVWAIYGAWFLMWYDPTQHFTLGIVFASLFFATFYFAMLFHRLAEDNFTIIEHTSLVLANAFVFYGFGYRMFDMNAELQNYLGLFTAAHAALHLAVALVISRLSPKAIDVVQVLTVLVLTFSSIAIPVQFDGNLVTMIWTVEGAVLFWYGRTRAINFSRGFLIR